MNWQAIGIFYLTINGWGFVLMGCDKWFAKAGKRRISERHLMTVAGLGGALGMTAAMFIFRHKTLHMKFLLGLPLFVVLHAIISGWIFINFKV
ncbi:MAG: DUF1294 domain-containing protein [Hyphomonadaceae bacterium]|nr:DUF1294 domain-containing protein [Clostridia bacterium]